MAKLPFMQWYPEDWIKDTRHLSLAAKGAWIDILNLMWVNEQSRGQYTATEPALARAIGTTPAEIKMLLDELKTVAEISFVSQGVTILSRRIVREENARKYERDRKKIYRQNGNVPPVSQKSPDAHTRDQRPETIIQRPDNTPPNSPPKGAFDKIWERYPRRKGRKAAQRHFAASVKTMKDWLDIQNALENYLAEIRRDHIDPQFVKHGSTWFNNWRDDVAYRGVEMPKAPTPPLKPKVIEKAPELTDDDLHEMHDSKVQKLGFCSVKDCKFCKQAAVVVSEAVKTASAGKAMAI